MKNIHTFEEFLNEGRNEKITFDPKLFYLIGKTSQGNYDFNRGGFKSKSGGNEVGPIGADMDIRKEQFKDAGYTDIRVITGTELAIMIVSGETSGYAGF